MVVPNKEAGFPRSGKYQASAWLSRAFVQRYRSAMTRTPIALLLMIAPAAAQPAEFSSKLCILEAAQKLPAIPGIVIVDSRAKPMPVKPSDSPTFNVEIDTKAAGKDATFGFVCIITPMKGAFVQALGLVR